MSQQNNSLREKAAIGGRWTAMSAITNIILQIAQIVVIGRLLSPAEFGLMAMMMIVIGLTNAIADFGLGNYIVQKERLSKKTLVYILTIAIGMSTLLAILVTLLSDLVAEYYNRPILTELLPWLSISIVASAVSQIFFSLLQRFFLFKQIAISEILSTSLTLISITVLAFTGYGVWSLVIGQIIGGVIRLIFFALPAAYLSKQLADTDNSDLLKAKEFIFYQTGERLLDYLGSNLDKIIIGRMLGDTGLGIYSVAYQLMIKPYSTLNPIFTRITLPLFVKVQNDDSRLVSGYLQTIKTIALILFPIYMVMTIAAPAVIFILMGDKWNESAPILYVLSLLGIIFSISNPIGTLILAKGKPRLAFYYNIISLLTYTIAFWIGSHYSALVVAVAFLVSSVIVLYPLEFLLRYKLVNMTIFEYFKAMQHLLIALGTPIMVHAFFYLPKMEAFNLANQLIMVLLALLFFISFIYKFDRDLIESTKNLILKGK